MIKTGDLVMVVKAKPCGCTNCVGRIFTVSRIYQPNMFFECANCGSVWPSSGLIVEGGSFGSPDFLCIKIDPPALPETIEQQDELTV